MRMTTIREHEQGLASYTVTHKTRPRLKNKHTQRSSAIKLWTKGRYVKESSGITNARYKTEQA